MTRTPRERIGSLTMVGELSAVVLVSLFAVLSLLLVGIGTRSYADVTADTVKVSRVRDSLNYVAGKLRASDGEATARIVQYEGGDALILSYGIDGDVYETRIFHHDGWLCEQFAPAATPLDAELSERIVEIGGFKVERGEVWTLTVTDTDGDTYTQYAAPRAARGEASAP